MGWARSCSEQLLRCCGCLRELLPRSDLPGAQQKTPFNVNRYVLLVMYVVGVACTGPIFFNWSPLAELFFRNEAFAELCKKDPVSGEYTPDLRRRRPQQEPSGDDGGRGDGGSGGGDPGDAGGGRSYICDLQEAAVQQLYTLCCAVCCCFCAVAGSLMDFTGPRVTMVAGRLLQTLGWLLLAFADVSSKLYYVGIAFFAAGVDAVVLPTLSVCRLFPESEGLIITVVGSALSASYAVPLVMKHFAEAYGASVRVVGLSYALLCPFAFTIVAFFFVPMRNFEHFPVVNEEAAAGVNDHAGRGEGGVGKGAASGGEAVATTASSETDEAEVGKGRIEEQHRRRTSERRGGGEEGGAKGLRMAARDNNREVEGRGEQQEGKRTEEGRDQEEEEDDDAETKSGSKRKTDDTNGDAWRRGSSSASTRGDRGVGRRYSGWQGDSASLEVDCVEQDDRRLESRPESENEKNSAHCKSRPENRNRTRGERGSARDSSRRGSNSSYNSGDAETRLQIRSCSSEEARHDNRSSRGVASHWIRKNEDRVSQRLAAVASPVVVVEEAGHSRNMHCSSASDATTRDRCCYTGACESSPGRQRDSETGTASAAAAAAAPAPACPAHLSQAVGTAVAGRPIRSAAAAAASHTVEEAALPAPRAIQSAAVWQSASSTTTDAVFLTDTATKNNSPPASVHLHHPPKPALGLSEKVRGGGAGLAAASGAAFSADSAACFVAGSGSGGGGAACGADAAGGAGPAAHDATAVHAAPVASAADAGAVEGGCRRQFRVEGVFAADAPCESEEDSKALLTTDSKGKSSSNNTGNSSKKTNRAGDVAHCVETGAAEGAARESSVLSAAADKSPEMIAVSVDSPTARNSCSSAIADIADITSSAPNSNSKKGRNGATGSHRWASTGCSSRRAGSCSNGGETEAAPTSATDATPTRMLEESPTFDASPEAGESFFTALHVTPPTAVSPPAAPAAESAEEETSSSVAAGRAQAVSRPIQFGSRSKRFPYAGLLSRCSDNSSLLLRRGVGSQQVTAAAAGGGPPTAGTGAAATPSTSCGGNERSEPAARPPVCTSDDLSGEEGITEGCNRSRSCCSSAAPPDSQKRGWRDWWMRQTQWNRSKSAVRQFLSERYMLIILYKIMVVLVSTYYQEASQRMFSARVLHMRALLLPFSFLPCIALGKAADRFGIVYVLFVVNFFGFATYFFSFFSQYSVAWAYVSSCFFVCYMSFYSSQIFIYVETTFSPEHFGKLSGVSLMVGGVTSLAAHPLYSQLTVGHHGGDTLTVRIALTVPIVLVNLLLVRMLLLYRQNPQPYRNAVCTDEELGGDTRASAAAVPEHPPQSGEQGCFCRKSSSSSKLHEFTATGTTALPNSDESPAAAPTAV